MRASLLDAVRLVGARPLGIFALMVCLAGSAASATKTKNKKQPAAVPQPPKAVGAAGLIAVAQRQLDAGNFGPAAEYAASAASKAPILDDYAQYIRAQAEYKLRNYGEVANSAARVFTHDPVSPFVGAAAALAVQAELDNNSAKNGLDLIRKYYDRIPQPQADLLLAQCFEGTGDLAQSAEHFQRVYYRYPSAKEAADAANALVGLKQRLGEGYPPPMASVMIQRAQKLFDSNNAAAAKIELAAAIPQLGGADRDLARVRLGVADYLGKNERDAFEYFSALKVDDPEADAERLSYLIRCARKLDHRADVKPFLTQLEQQHANSPWRLDALIFTADEARLDHDTATYTPLYRACQAAFPKEHRAAWCDWQLAFESYRSDGADSSDLLRRDIQQYPDSEQVNDALYFLGRLYERKNDLASARACYNEMIARFPNTYYAVVVRERLKNPGIQASVPSPALLQFLQSLAWPPRPEFPSFVPGKLASVRIERSRLLNLTGLTEFAEGELKFGAKNDGEQQNLYALELARLAASHDAPDQAMRYIKHFAPGYLYMPFDQAPAEFWKYAFPIPYRASIEQHSRDESLDPFLVAALIRQESEFNVKVISHANAYGLMQLLPTTGRQLAHHFGIKRFNASQLLTADRNVQLGAFYFHNLLNSYGGQIEYALASYNAGPGRANLWRTWGPFREQAEFIETVPFHETRGYIQVVLRNADVYRRLYAGTTPDLPAYHPKPAPKRKQAKRTSRKSHRAPRNAA